MALSLPQEIWECSAVGLIDDDHLSSSASIARDIASLARTSKDSNLQAGVAAAWHALAATCGVQASQKCCPSEFGSWENVEADVGSYDVPKLKTCLRALGQPVSGRKADLVARVLAHLPSGRPTASDALQQQVKREKNSLICQTDAIKQFRLKKEDFARLWADVRANPHNPWGEMRLYRVVDAKNEKLADASAKRRKTAAHNLFMRPTRHQELVQAIAEVGLQCRPEDLHTPAAEKYIKSGTGSLAKLVETLRKGWS
ncbi:hypothetical protein WJX72_004726 [[Myrmecia] bisecta]|uniref:SAP domain-containing protein n=1 Tax=[Myrmecia] bisecta TaxID=41462 RepID=A0AAW1PL85_9CHLO